MQWSRATQAESAFRKSVLTGDWRDLNLLSRDNAETIITFVWILILLFVTILIIHYKKFFNRPFGPIIKTVEIRLQTIDELNMENNKSSISHQLKNC